MRERVFAVREREQNYDLLRIIATVVVIMNHVCSSIWFTDAVGGRTVDEIQSLFWICVYYYVPISSVPCFVMLSGAFILDDDRNMEYKNFYSKSFAKLGIPTLIFSIAYILIRLFFCFLGVQVQLDTLLNDIVRGEPMYHMWYLYMLIGVYALAPIVLRFKKSVSEKSFYIVSFVFLAWACASHCYANVTPANWDAGQAFEYLGYFMAGYSIRKLCRKKSNPRALLMICLGVLLELGMAFAAYREISVGTAENVKYEVFLLYYYPQIILASLLIFYGFALLDVKRNFGKMSGLTFYIYLIHVGAWEFICVVVGMDTLAALNGAVWTLIFTAAVLALSIAGSKIYLWLWGRIDKGKRVTNWLTRLVRLEVNN